MQLQLPLGDEDAPLRSLARCELARPGGMRVTVTAWETRLGIALRLAATNGLAEGYPFARRKKFRYPPRPVKPDAFQASSLLVFDDHFKPAAAPPRDDAF